MKHIKDGVSANRKGRSRPILTLGKGSNGSNVSAQLGGVERDQLSENGSELQRFEDALWSARNRWDIGRRCLPTDASDWLNGGGFAGRGKLSRTDADAMWTQAMAAFARNDSERKPNALAKVGRDGAK
ncbi:hypothetical protein [Pelagerythrobacter sp.]|uniref:hypothetical protein n=1 Tax=Pelagerythrobacter sp. TaxID=2800702 RepID=UPI0035AFEA5F